MNNETKNISKSLDTLNSILEKFVKPSSKQNLLTIQNQQASLKEAEEKQLKLFSPFNLVANVPKAVSLSNHNHVIIVNDSSTDIHYSTNLTDSFTLFLRANEAITMDFFNQKLFYLRATANANIRILSW